MNNSRSRKISGPKSSVAGQMPKVGPGAAGMRKPGMAPSMTGVKTKGSGKMAGKGYC